MTDLDMPPPGRYHIPPRNCLIAFESIARHGCFSRAADELGTSQATISRRIAALESALPARLFERSPAGLALTEAGRRFRDGVCAGLYMIRSAAGEAARLSCGDRVVVACTHDMYHLVVRPRRAALLDALGESVRLCLLVHERGSEDGGSDPAADLALTWNPAEAVPGAVPGDMALMFAEEVRPVCSPGYAEAHAGILGGPVAGWSGLTLLDMARPDPARAGWPDWFAAAAGPAPECRRERFDGYVDLLEAAAAGRGVALGRRHCFERYFDSGALVMLGEAFVACGGRFVAVLTAKGRGNPAARLCLSFFGGRSCP